MTTTSTATRDDITTYVIVAVTEWTADFDIDAIVDDLLAITDLDDWAGCNLPGAIDVVDNDTWVEIIQRHDVSA